MLKSKYIFFIFIFYFTGCKKYSDYRSKFLGNYYFQVHRQIKSGFPTVTVYDSVFYYNGKAEFGSDPHSVLIYFSDNLNIEPTIYEDGTLEGYLYGYTKGEFESVKRVMFHYGWASPGSSTDYYVTGEKK